MAECVFSLISSSALRVPLLAYTLQLLKLADLFITGMVAATNIGKEITSYSNLAPNPA